MVNISPRTTGGPITDDPSWIGGSHGIGTNETGTLNLALFSAQTHAPDGFLPSGTPVAKVTSTGLYGPYTPSDSPAGLGVLVGFLYHPVDFSDPNATVSVGIYVHGGVVEDRLPTSALDSDGKDDVAGRIWFV